jgi:hypothetical protein
LSLYNNAFLHINRGVQTMRKVPFIIAGVVAMTTAYAEAAPPVIAKKEAPTKLGVTVCRVDDWTGKRPLPEGVIPSRDWRDLEWHRDPLDHSLSCKFLTVQLEDAVAMNYSNKEAAALHPDWSDAGQCSARSMDFAPRWAEQNKGWWPLAIGCPKRVVQRVTGEDGTQVDVIIDYQTPPCPSYEPGTNFPMKCKFDESMI